MTLIRSQVLTIIRGVHPFYQRHERWLSPIKEMALQLPPLKRLRDAAIDGREQRSDRRKLNAALALQGRDAATAVPSLIEASHAGAMPIVFEDVILFYREEVRYNDLQFSVNCFSEWLENNYLSLSQQKLAEYLETLAFGVRSLNGRVVSKVPYIDLTHLQSQSVSRRAYIAYIMVLSDNLEFSRVGNLLETLISARPNLLFQAIAVLQRKPARVELDAIPRLLLLDQVVAMLRETLNALNVDEIFVKFIIECAHGDTERFISSVQKGVISLPPIAQAETEEWVLRLAPIFKSVIRKLITLDRPDLARTLLGWLKSLLSEKMTDDIETRLAIHNLSSAAAYDYLKTAAENSSTARTFLVSFAWDRNDFKLAKAIAEQPLSGSVPLRRQIARKSTIDRLQFLEQTSEIVNRVKQPDQPAGYVLLASLNCFNTLAMVTPAMIELKQKGFAIGSLMKGVIDQQPPSAADATIASLFNSIERTREDGDIALDWKVDWANRVVSAEGINFYQGIYETLSNIYRRATISIDNEPVTSTFQSIIRRCDYILRACKRIESAVKYTDQPIILLGSNAHVAPYSVFRDFALARNLPNLRYVVASVAYENYYTNLGSKTSGSMAVVDMTLHKNCRAPFLAIPDRFEHWYRCNEDSKEVQQQFEELIAKNRTGSDEGVHTSPAAEALRRARQEGRRIVCCFGKILCDLAVPYDGGPAHSDMLDWVRHSVDIARANPELLLLIKPHPHELRPEIALELTEKLEDILPENIPENVIILKHSEFNTGDLAQYLDLAVLWNGTACLELTGLGVPVVMCSDFGRHDYPISLHYPRDRLDYENLLAADAVTRPDYDLRKKAMALLHYMGTKEVAIPNLYSRRPITNDSIGVPTWYMDKISDFFDSGDSYMTIAANRIIEGVETSS